MEGRSLECTSAGTGGSPLNKSHHNGTGATIKIAMAKYNFKRIASAESSRCPKMRDNICSSRYDEVTVLCTVVCVPNSTRLRPFYSSTTTNNSLGHTYLLLSTTTHTNTHTHTLTHTHIYIYIFISRTLSLLSYFLLSLILHFTRPSKPKLKWAVCKECSPRLYLRGCPRWIKRVRLMLARSSWMRSRI